MTLPTPYYSRDGITIYHGDCRDILPLLEAQPATSVIITDPVWPNALPSLAGSDDPYRLLADAAQHFPWLARRVVIHMGCLSDPRFLMAIPPDLPFVRVCWLRFARPSYRGCQLSGSDVAYIFGDPSSRKMPFHVFPGESMTATDWKDTRRRAGHPAPRKVQHVRWLIGTWTREGDTVVDPFMGSGTTAASAKLLGHPYVGIEIEEQYCRAAVKRLRQGVLQEATA